MAQKRLIKDLKRIHEDPPTGIMAAPNDDDIFHWSAVICGPEGTEWEGGVFKLSMAFSPEYPNKAPEVKFVSEIFHPNGKNKKLFKIIYSIIIISLFLVYSNGDICLDILKHNWSPIYDVAAILTSIQSLLTDPNTKSPANADAARLYDNNKREYFHRVKEIVDKSLEDFEDDDDDEDMDDAEDDDDEDDE